MSDLYPPSPEETGYPGSGFQPPQAPPPSGKATAALVLGICSLLLWLCPFIGIAVAIVGLVLGIQARGVNRSGMSTAGIVMSVIGLVLSLINGAWGAYMAVTGQHPFVQQGM